MLHVPLCVCYIAYRQLDRIEEGVGECNDRQVTKWRAEQDRDHALREQIDGRIGMCPPT